MYHAFSSFHTPEKTALVVSRNAKEREVLELQLSSLDYKVLSARTFQGAIDLLRDYEGAIHLLITDISLPGDTGWALAETAAKLRPGIFVLFLSADTSAHDAPRKPAGSILSKPVTSSALLDMTRALQRGYAGRN